MSLFRIALVALCVSLGIAGGLAAFDLDAFAKTDEARPPPSP